MDLQALGGQQFFSLQPSKKHLSLENPAKRFLEIGKDNIEKSELKPLKKEGIALHQKTEAEQLRKVAEDFEAIFLPSEPRK